MGGSRVTVLLFWKRWTGNVRCLRDAWRRTEEPRKLSLWARVSLSTAVFGRQTGSFQALRSRHDVTVRISVLISAHWNTKLLPVLRTWTRTLICSRQVGDLCIFLIRAQLNICVSGWSNPHFLLWINQTFFVYRCQISLYCRCYFFLFPPFSENRRRSCRRDSRASSEDDQEADPHLNIHRVCQLQLDDLLLHPGPVFSQRGDTTAASVEVTGSEGKWHPAATACSVLCLYLRNFTPAL